MIIGHRHDSTAPQSPARGPEPSVAIDRQVVDDVTGERDAVARILPRLGTVGGDVNLTTARTEKQKIGIGGIGDQRANVGTEESGTPPLCR